MQLRMLKDVSRPSADSAAVGIALPNEAMLALERPQETWVILEADGCVTACCSLWWHDTPQLEGHIVGYIGHFATANRDAANALIRHAVGRLTQNGCGIAIAPVNGSTWRDYRLVIEAGDRPSFFLEPQNPCAWVDDLTSTGFKARATYRSTKLQSGDLRDPRLPELERRFQCQGVRIRPLERTGIEDQLGGVYQLVLACFRDNFLYSRISKHEFLARYDRIVGLVDPRHVLLAKRGDDLVGIAFAVPDHSQMIRKEPVDTLILKTLAVRPERELAGLGRVLMNRINRQAADDGYGWVIHALMHEGNRSLAYSQRSSTTFRRYGLFARYLA